MPQYWGFRIGLPVSKLGQLTSKDTHVLAALYPSSNQLVESDSPAFGVPIVATGRATPSQPKIITAVDVEKKRAGPAHKIDLKCNVVKENPMMVLILYSIIMKNHVAFPQYQGIAYFQSKVTFTI
jgi:hypothetical protein